MKVRRLILVVVLGVVVLSFAPIAFGLLASLDPITPHEGDGVFQDLSRRVGGFAVPGYSISFAEFDLGKEYKGSFQVSSLPGNPKRCGFYLAINDPNDHWFIHGANRQLGGYLQLEARDSQGRVVISLGGALREFVWGEWRGAHRLYQSPGSFFRPTKGEEYTFHISYSPDAQLASFTGYGYLESGGSK